MNLFYRAIYIAISSIVVVHALSFCMAIVAYGFTPGVAAFIDGLDDPEHIKLMAAGATILVLCIALLVASVNLTGEPLPPALPATRVGWPTPKAKAAASKKTGVSRRNGSKTTIKQRQEIRREFREGNVTRDELAEMYGVSKSRISAIIRGE